MASFLLFKYNKNDQSKEDEMGWPFNTHVRSQKYIRLLWKNLKGRDRFEEPDIDERILLN
jgi:hypothetical protein